MNEQGSMMNQRMSQSQMMSSMSQPQVLNPPQQQQQMQPPPPQMMNRSYGMWQQLQPSVDQMKFQNPNPNSVKPPQVFVPGKHSKPLGPRNNWKGKKVNKNEKRTGVAIGIAGAGANIGGPPGGYKPPTLNDLQRQNRLKARRFFPKRKFHHRCDNSNMNAPFAPRNTSSYIIRAKKSGGIASLVSPCPVTPAVLPTPIFSPSREVLVDMAKEEWGVDGYGSMNGLIRLRSPGHEAEAHEDEDEEDGGESSESDVEEHVEVERRLDHDLSRFEMIYPNYESNNVLGNHVDDQDTHIAQLEEENLILKDRLFLMERELGDLRRRLQSLERQGPGCEEINEEVVENESENESESHTEGHSLEDNDVEGEMANRIEGNVELAQNGERVGKEYEEDSTNGIDETAKREGVEVRAENQIQITHLNENNQNNFERSDNDNATSGDVTVEEAAPLDGQTKKEDEVRGNE